jgi:sigma-B regulation protein RsbU (phosphoserine phosphatase)
MHSLTARLLLPLSLCLGGILALGMAVDYHLSRQQILAQVEHESATAIERVIGNLENLLAGIESDAQLVARILEQRPYSEAGLQQILRDFVDNNPDITSAAIALNPRGQEAIAPFYSRENDIPQLRDLADNASPYWQQPWYTGPAAARRALWVEPYFDSGGAQTTMTTYAVPVLQVSEAGERELYAVLTADITLHKLQHYLQHLHLGHSGYALLFSAKGRILSGGDPAQLMRHYRDIVETPQAAQALGELIAASGDSTVVRRDVHCPAITGNCIARFSRLAATDWPIAILYSQQELLKPLRQFELKLAALGVLTLLCAALALAWATRRITRPVTALARASEQIAQGNLNAGLPSATGQDELSRLVGAFAGMKRDLKAQMAALEQATERRARLEGELNAARDIQMAMLPQGNDAWLPHDAGTLWAGLRPARSVGGDLYYYCESEGQLLFAVGDVSDKGAPAALFMARAITAIQRLQPPYADLGLLLSSLNDQLEAGNSNCMFVTLFVGVLDTRSQTLRFASAGHCAPCLITVGSARELPQVSGPALGLAPQLDFEENRIALEPGDRLAVYSDGIDEAFNAAGEMFSLPRLLTALDSVAHLELCAAGHEVIAAVDAFAGEVPQSDDITLLMLELPAQRQHQRFVADNQLPRAALSWLTDTLEQWRVAAEQIGEATLIVEELLTNIAHHAQLPPNAEVELQMALTTDRLRLQVSDPGAAYNPLQQARRAPLGQSIADAEIGGLGVHLVEQLSARQHYARLAGRNRLSVELKNR